MEVLVTLFKSITVADPVSNIPAEEGISTNSSINVVLDDVDVAVS